MKRLLKILIIVALFIVLAGVRYFETLLFYDPLLDFFHSDYLNNIAPEFDFFKLVGYTSLRYLLNTAISLLILYAAFQDSGILKFSSILYGLVFLVLLSVFAIMLSQSSSITNFMPLFYVRRFLIQPLLIILLLPAFYYYKQQQG